MCAGLISVICCSSMANRWLGSNFLIVPNAQIITDTIFVLTFHILLTLTSRSLYLPSFSVSFVQLSLFITFQQGTYSDITEINHMYRVPNVTDNLWLMSNVMLYPTTDVLYFYISTFWSMCAVPSMVVSCSLLMFCFPSMSLRQFLIDSKLVPVFPILLVYYYYYYYCDYLIITYINAPYGKASIGLPSPNPYLVHLCLLDLCLLSQEHN
jgi:hypothetical protein